MDQKKNKKKRKNCTITLQLPSQAEPNTTKYQEQQTQKENLLENREPNHGEKEQTFFFFINISFRDAKSILYWQTKRMRCCPVHKLLTNAIDVLITAHSEQRSKQTLKKEEGTA